MNQERILEREFFTKVALNHVDRLKILDEITKQESFEQPSHIVFYTLNNSLHCLTLVHGVVSLDNT